LDGKQADGSRKIAAKMIIPEILEYIEDADLEDWLTAAFIEREHELPLKALCTNGGYPSPSSAVDIWMVEITSRTGKVWTGKFSVEFFEESQNGSETEHLAQHQTGELFFSLNIETGQVTFVKDAWPVVRSQNPDPELVPAQ
jgi:hypothetical protein